MPLSNPQSMTVDDLYTMPDDGRRHELVEGTLLSEPLPGARHGRIAFRIARLLGDHVERHNLGEILVGDSGFILSRGPDTVRGPDVAFVCRSRYAAAGDPAGAFEGPPDLAVEVLSPSDRPAELRSKVADYLAAGTPRVWLVDPERHIVTEYRHLLEPRILREADILDGGPALSGFSVRVADLF